MQDQGRAGGSCVLQGDLAENVSLETLTGTLELRLDAEAEDRQTQVLSGLLMW